MVEQLKKNTKFIIFFLAPFQEVIFLVNLQPPFFSGSARHFGLAQHFKDSTRVAFQTIPGPDEQLTRMSYPPWTISKGNASSNHFRGHVSFPGSNIFTPENGGFPPNGKENPIENHHF